MKRRLKEWLARHRLKRNNNPYDHPDIWEVPEHPKWREQWDGNCYTKMGRHYYSLAIFADCRYTPSWRLELEELVPFTEDPPQPFVVGEPPTPRSWNTVQVAYLPTARTAQQTLREWQRKLPEIVMEQRL